MPNAYKPSLIQVRPQYSMEQPGELEPNGPENVLWFSGANPSAFPLTVGQLSTIAGTFDPYWSSMWSSVASSDGSYTGSQTTDWSSDTGIDVTTVGSFTPVPGAETGKGPAQLAMLLSYVAPLLPRYRGGHPRTYLPFMSSSLILTPYSWTTATPGYVAEDWNTMVTAMAALPGDVGGPYQPVVFRFRNNPATAALYAISGVNVDLRPATQRRRIRKVAHT